MNSIVIVVSALLIAVGLYNRKLQASETYQAFVSPFSSIMDIGFLAVIPLIVTVMGLDAAWFVTGVAIVAYLMGAVIRYNIHHLDPEEDRAHARLRWLIPLSSWILAGAYAINIAYYLQLLGVLAMALFDTSNAVAINMVATIVLALIGIVGFTAGLAKLSALGEKTIPINLAVIGAFLIGLLYFNIDAALSGQWQVAEIAGKSDFTSIRKVLGTLVIVQGFEISLYFGNLYPAEMRTRTMRYAQILSGAIFVATFALLTILFDVPTDVEGVGAVIDISGVVSEWLPWFLVFGAIGSQLSASISNVAGGGNLLVETVGERLKPRVSYQLIVIPAIILTWLTDINQVISLASRAFAAYYAVECIIGMFLLTKEPLSAARTRQMVGFGLMAVFMAFITLFSIPT